MKSLRCRFLASFLLLSAGLLALDVARSRASAVAAEPSPEEGEPLDVRDALVLDTEPIGIPTGGAMFRLLPPGKANDASPWKQLLWFKKTERTVRKSYFASLDFAKGTVREFPNEIPSILAWSQMWLDGKLYVTMHVMPRLAVYDPAADTLTDLGNPFPEAAPPEKPTLSLYSIAASPDGAIALGGGNGTDLAVYDPKTGKFTSYGQIGPPGQEGYVYYVSMDEKFIYCALRHTGPCQLVAVNRATKERKVLATRSPEGFISVDGNRAELIDENKNKVWIHLENGTAEEVTPEESRRRLDEHLRPGFTEVREEELPKAYVDDSLIEKGELAIRVLVPDPSVQGKFNEKKLEAGLSTEGILDIAALPDGRIAAVARGYGPTVIADPTGKRNELVQTRTSCYSVAAVGKMLFVGGYPGARVLVYDTSKPQTSTIELPDRPAVPIESPEANPRQVASFLAATDGGHIACCLTPASDGRVYFIARRHRFHYGFALVWCDGEGKETGIIDDQGAFNHYQIGWMSPANQGGQLLIATSVQYNEQIPGTAAEDGALFVFDVKTRKILAKHTPLPKVKALLGVVQTGPDTVVGVGQLESGSSVLYRFNLKTGKTEQTRTLQTTVCGPAYGSLSVPVRSNAFVLGPDGQVWAGACDKDGGAPTLFFRIDPKDLACQIVGKIEDNRNRLLFSGGELYTTGSAHVIRLKGWK
ncbi:MAG: hypothetical protein IT578_09640 [Verrucomicrobiae bacterium]|nr:hypothetical protein [Verrucomicrobiae bacterium]